MLVSICGQHLTNLKRTSLLTNFFRFFFQVVLLTSMAGFLNLFWEELQFQ